MNRRTLLTALLGAAALPAQSAGRKTRNLLLVTTDGLRWQDVFRGADPALMNKTPGGVSNLEFTKGRYWRDSAAARRAALMPFLWSVVAKQGQILGNRDLGSEAYVTNGKNFSYPGYNEMLTGYGDPRVDSNDKKNNPNVNALEWLNRQPAYRDKVAAFAAWDVFPYILNARRSGLLVNAGYDPFPAASNPRIELLNRLKVETGVWGGEPLDAPMAHTALEYFRSARPRVLYVALGDTDEWAHGGRYDLYLESANRVDAYIRELWETAQSLPQYKDATTLFIAVDHGRGDNTETWKGHGQKIPDSKDIWLAAMGPDIRPLGERSRTPAVTQSQTAATLLAILGEDYKAFSAQAAPPIHDLLARP
jgi:hypothetical protein